MDGLTRNFYESVVYVFLETSVLSQCRIESLSVPVTAWEVEGARVDGASPREFIAKQIP